MTTITIHLNKSVEENASLYYEKAKKIKKKIEGAKKALEDTLKRLEELEGKKSLEGKQETQRIFIGRRKEWYEKFRWFISSEGFLVIGGRDATTNEMVIKKYTEQQDLVFHTDMRGSPFFVVKSDGKTISHAAIQETADATCTFSRAWNLGLSTTPVFYVKPEQIGKEAPAGEYLTKGAFIIKGHVHYVENKMNCAVGLREDLKIMSGPLEAVKRHCKNYVEIVQGNEKVSKIAKMIKHLLRADDLDEIIRALPGECKIKR